LTALNVIRRHFAGLLFCCRPTRRTGEELWHLLGHNESYLRTFPNVQPAYLTEDTFEYPVSVNGMVRAINHFSPLDTTPAEIEKSCWIGTCAEVAEGKQPKKVIVCPGRS